MFFLIILFAWHAVPDSKDQPHCAEASAELVMDAAVAFSNTVGRMSHVTVDLERKKFGECLLARNSWATVDFLVVADLADVLSEKILATEESMALEAGDDSLMDGFDVAVPVGSVRELFATQMTVVAFCVLELLAR